MAVGDGVRAVGAAPLLGVLRERRIEGWRVILIALEGVHVWHTHQHGAMFGAEFPPDEEIKRPGNLRTIAVTLRVACQRVVDLEMSLNAELVVDGEPFTFTVDRGVVDVKASKAKNPEATLTTSYEPMIAVADGQMSLDELGTHHMELSGPQGQALAELMGHAMMHMTAGAPQDSQPLLT